MMKGNHDALKLFWISRKTGLTISAILFVAAVMIGGTLGRTEEGAQEEVPAGPQPAPPAAILEHWRQADRHLTEVAGQYFEIEKRKRSLRRDMNNAKERFAPSDFSPGSILARRKMTQVASEYDALASESRRMRDEMGQVILRIAGPREPLEEALRSRKKTLDRQTPDSLGEAERKELDRLNRWLEGVRRAEEEGPQGFFIALFGEEIVKGPESLVARAGRDGSRPPIKGQGRPQVRPGPDGNFFSGPPGDWAAVDFPLLMQRLERLEQSHLQLSKIIERQGNEIRTLRKAIERSKLDPSMADRAPEDPGSATDRAPEDREFR